MPSFSSTTTGRYQHALSHMRGKNIFHGCLFLSLSSWVLYVNGKERITDCPAVNTGQWYHIGVSWRSWDGDWRIYINGKPSDGGKGLSVGTTIPGGVLTSTCSACLEMRFSWVKL